MTLKLEATVAVRTGGRRGEIGRIVEIADRLTLRYYGVKFDDGASSWFLAEDIALPEVGSPSFVDQRARWREGYRIAINVLHRMHLSNQPIPACTDQAKVVQQLRTDLASTFRPGERVRVFVHDEWKEGEYFGISSYQALCVYVPNNIDGLLVTVEADLVIGADEELPTKELAHALS